MVNLEALVDLQPLEHAAHGRMLDLADLLHVFDDRIDDAKAMVEERRQLAHADVAVLVDGRRQHGAAVLADTSLDSRCRRRKMRSETVSG